MSDERCVDTLGSVIKSARRSQNLTQSELASRLKITPRYLKAIENSGKKPSYNLLARISHELGISMDEVFLPEKNMSVNIYPFRCAK